MSKSHIVELNAAVRDAIEFRSYEDEDQGTGLGFPVGAAVAGGLGAGALTAGGLYARGRYVAGPVQPGMKGIVQTMDKGVAGLRGDLDVMKGKVASGYGAARGYAGRGVAYGKGVGGAFKDAYGDFQAMRQAGAGQQGLLAALKNSGKGLLGKLRGLKFSNPQKLIELNEYLSEAIEFRAYEDDETRIGNTLGYGAKGAMIGAGAGAAIGAVVNPMIAKHAIGEYRKTVKDGFGNMGAYVPKTNPVGRKGKAAAMNFLRTVSQGGVKGRMIGAGLAAAGYGLAGAGIGATYGMFRRPRTAEERGV